LGFWLVTLPVTLFTVLNVLVWWPGLEFKWVLGENWQFARFHRGNGDQTVDSATLKAGWLMAFKQTYPSGSPTFASTLEPGFQSVNSAGGTAWFFVWDAGWVGTGMHTE
jgi:hypothetical protein